MKDWHAILIASMIIQAPHTPKEVAYFLGFVSGVVMILNSVGIL